MKKLPFRKGNRIRCRCCDQKGKFIKHGIYPDTGQDCFIHFVGHLQGCGAYLKDLVHQTKPTWFVYLVRCKDDSLYCGTSIDPNRRVKEHNSSFKGSKYCRSKRPVVLVWCEEFKTRSQACELESRIKKLPKSKKEDLVAYN